MTKDLFDLTTYEFVAILLGYSPKQRFSLAPPSIGKVNFYPYEGTYWEIYEQLSGSYGLQMLFSEEYFDYSTRIDRVGAINYLRHRTDNYSPDLTEALLEDMNAVETQLFNEIRCNYQNEEQYQSWFASSTSAYFKVKTILEKKNDESKKDTIDITLSPHNVDSRHHGDRESDSTLASSRNQNNGNADNADTSHSVVSISSRFSEYLAKASSLFVDGRWHNNERMEYAVFLKVLFCIVCFKEWDNKVPWRKLPIQPRQNGTLLSSRQLTEAMKNYEESIDGGIRNGFDMLLRS